MAAAAAAIPGTPMPPPAALEAVTTQQAGSVTVCVDSELRTTEFSAAGFGQELQHERPDHIAVGNRLRRDRPGGDPAAGAMACDAHRGRRQPRTEHGRWS